MAGTSNQTSSSSFSSSSRRWDVFLSFRGEDIRKTFVDHLYTALDRAGIQTFKYDPELRKGEEISTALLNAIQDSRMSIVVFSKSYASSRWCLDELAKIVECKRTKGQTVHPVFYDVDPSDVRHQLGSFAEAIEKHKLRFIDKVKIWRDALTEVSNISGYHLINDAYGHESKLIENIVKIVLKEVNPKALIVDKHLVGMDFHVEDLYKKISIGSSNLRVIGIHGMGGVGKTTIAKAFYNKYFHRFECSCFLENVREVSQRHDGPLSLVHQLIYELLEKQDFKVATVGRGISFLKQRVTKKVLIVLDDLDKLSQSKLLVSHWNFFVPESRIIITTRDTRIIDEFEKIDEGYMVIPYMVETLDKDQSLELFRYHAFRGTNFSEEEILERIVSYAGGLPLALKVLGSLMWRRTKEQWTSILEKLQNYPNEIQTILEISYDSLDSSEKEIFLDIAFFLVGMDKEEANHILDSCGFSPHNGIKVLEEKCLLTIDRKNKFRMHDLIQDMGRKIVREKSVEKPGERSRLWCQEDVWDVLKKQKGTKKIEGIGLDITTSGPEYFDAKTYESMPKLRLLQINNAHLTGSFENSLEESRWWLFWRNCFLTCLPLNFHTGSFENSFEELRWFCWRYCPLTCLPPNFHAPKLVSLDMQYNNVNTLWEGPKDLISLKFLNASHSQYLTTTPDFGGVTMLEKLSLRCCSSLEQVHPSIGLLKKLVHLDLGECTKLERLPEQFGNMEGLQILDASNTPIEQLPDSIGHMVWLVKLFLRNCRSLRSLPSSICNLSSLEELGLNGCFKLVGLPAELGKMKSLRKLLASRTAIEQLPDSVGDLSRLVSLTLSYCKSLRNLPNSIGNLSSLEQLDLDGCSELVGLPEELGKMKSLRKLDASHTAIKQLPDSVGDLSRLASLTLSYCKNLRNLPNSICNLSSLELDLDGSSELVGLPAELRKMKSLRKLDASVTAIEQLPDSTAIEQLPDSIGDLNSWNVFLSFRGKDTRKTFTGHLYTALDQAGIRIFKDDPELQRGEEISSELLDAIENSKISIVVFSKNYADSSWCLDVLVKILECKRTKRQIVLPVFYDVDPSDVRHQIGSFGESFEKHKKHFVGDKVAKWQAALTEVANLSGYVRKYFANGDEAELIKEIVGNVRIKFIPKHMNVAEHLVGIDSHIDEINKKLSIGSNEVRFIGIYGMGGIGKTTIAKAVYNRFFGQFEGSCFLENIREISEQPNGILRLHKKLISETLKIKDIKIRHVNQGIHFVKERLGSKRILIVLDDLDQISQLNYLAGNPNWFGAGSRIIITSRDERLLDSVRVDVRYELTELNYYESLELFSWHAFNQSIPSGDFMEISNNIVRYTGGLPSALEVLGSHLFRRTMIEWESAFEKLEKFPHNQIQEILRISYDALDDDTTRNTFLDIACFFIGWDKDDTIMILDACGFFSELDIRILRERCLLKFDDKNRLRMNNLVRDMGREIVRRESPEKPGRRSRLWCQGDVCHVLEKNKGTEKIEGIILDLSASEQIRFDTRTFERMQSLRFLEMKNVQLFGSFDNLFKELRLFCWQLCSLKCLPSSFHPTKLVSLDLSGSKLNILWEGAKYLPNLKILNVSSSQCLKTTPDFEGVVRLAKLYVSNCTSLLRVHPSIGYLERLVHLDLSECTSLKRLPGQFWNMKGLQILDASDTAIEQLPDSIESGHMVRLVRLFLRNCRSLGSLPSSICNLSSLEELYLNGCFKLVGLPAELGKMTSLRKLDAGKTAIERLPDSVGDMSELVSLTLSDCKNLRNLPNSICNLSSVEDLYLDGCSELVRLPAELGKMKSLCFFEASDTAIEQLPDSVGDLRGLVCLRLHDCKNIRNLPNSICNLSSLKELDLDGCSELVGLPAELGKMKSLKRLDASATAIKQLPDSVRDLRRLVCLRLRDCKNLINIPNGINLEELDIDE